MGEPVSLEQAKARLGVRSNHRDAELEQLIPAARRKIENLTGYILVRRQLVQSVDRYDRDLPVELHYYPVIAVDGVQARDADGVLQDVAGPRLIQGAVPPARLFSPVSALWPLQGNPAGLEVTVTAGYDVDAVGEDPYKEIPEDLLVALYMLLAHWFENHEAIVVGAGVQALEVPMGVKDICSDYRLPGIV
jgi:uncharacterized phiE125 gp8 family phage protein